MTLTATGRHTPGEISTGGRRSTPPRQSFELCLGRSNERLQLTDRERRQPALVRRIACAFLNKWELPHCRGSVCLLASELVTNALVHGRGSVRFRMVNDGAVLELSVGSEAPTPELMVSPTGELDESGRGLMLVQAVAESWGVKDERVWCTISTRPAREA